jgi:hypothetical protein
MQHPHCDDEELPYLVLLCSTLQQGLKLLFCRQAYEAATMADQGAMWYSNNNKEHTPAVRPGVSSPKWD